MGNLNGFSAGRKSCTFDIPLGVNLSLTICRNHGGFDLQIRVNIQFFRIAGPGKVLISIKGVLDSIVNDLMTL